jgi:glucose-6-phosphate 1-epimerase
LQEVADMTISQGVSATEAPSLELTAPDGASARVYLDGAQVTSWIPAGANENRLFVSAQARYGPGESIRGGIPVCFPQFGTRGGLRQHGFARNLRWTVVRNMVADDGARAVLRLADSDETRAVWPFEFQAELSVHVAGASLTVELTVSNTDGQPFEFTAAFHPYFRVRDAYGVEIRGLSGTRYQDALRDGQLFDERDATLRIDGAIDRIYHDTPDLLEVHEPDRVLRIEKRGFPDAVVWNPGAAGTAAKADFVAGDEQHMLCVEAGVIHSPVALAPGKQWTGTQVMTALAGKAPPV